MLDLKGFHGHPGLEGYRAFEAHNLGSQVPNGALVAKAIELDADAILVSQTVTQQNLHIHNLTELVEIVEAEGRRPRTILACGGPRVSNELAKELGYDAGFSRGTYPHHLATFLVRELAARTRSAVPARTARRSELPPARRQDEAAATSTTRADDRLRIPGSRARAPIRKARAGRSGRTRAKMERLRGRAWSPIRTSPRGVRAPGSRTSRRRTTPRTLAAGEHEGLAYRIAGA